jgi:hypothetical protein
MFVALGAAALAAAQQQDSPDPLAQARGKLQKALTTMAALPSCSFAAKWGPDEKAKKAEAGGPVIVQVAGGGTFGPSAPGAASGSWTPAGLHLQIDDKELLLAGRRMLAKDANQDWTLRQGRLADGSSAGYLPDPQLLLEMLARMDLAVVHREVGMQDDRPVELLTATLNQDQVADLVWAGALPLGSAGIGAQMFFAGAIAAGAKAARPAPPKPDATVDLCFKLDPGTGLVHGLHFRCYSKNELVAGGRAVFVAAGGGGIQVGGGADEEEEEAEQPAGKQEQRFENGLPVRSRKKLAVTDYALDLKDHGKAKLPELGEQARSLLGR